MRVLFAAAEVFPWVKTGGLGDVAAALPPALARNGVDCRLVLPGFPGFIDAFRGLSDAIRLATPFTAERVRIGCVTLPGTALRAYVVDHPAFFDRPGNPYADPDGRDWPDNHRRFALLSWVTAQLARGADPSWRPDLLHCHDWHTGLAPAYLAAEPANRPPVVFTIHNLAYQGFFPARLFPELALPSSFFSMYGLEFYGQISFMKAGLYYADRLTTVSPTYAREIQTASFGCGLDGLLRTRAGALNGILNGVDPAIWDPQHDPTLPHAYGVDTAPAAKPLAKAALQRFFGLTEDATRPLFGCVTRLTSQKGLDLLLGALPELVEAGGQLALLGSGDRDLELGFTARAQDYPGAVGIVLGYDEVLAHRIIGGADLMLVPSRFEPCGLTQLYALRYGTLPLVRRVGGLADTVVDARLATVTDGTATGFAFDGEQVSDLTEAIRRAIAAFPNRESWVGMMRNAMQRDFSWEAAAKAYVALYGALCLDISGPPR